MRIVIDSNVWISALVFGGKPRQVLERCVQSGIQIALSEEIITEVRRNIRRKFAHFLPDFESLLIALDGHIERVALGSITISVSRDPDDNHVIETAAISNADYIVSGDKDLLVLQRHETIRIVTPGEFMAVAEQN